VNSSELSRIRIEPDVNADASAGRQSPAGSDARIGVKVAVATDCSIWLEVGTTAAMAAWWRYMHWALSPVAAAAADRNDSTARLSVAGGVTALASRGGRSNAESEGVGAFAIS